MDKIELIGKVPIFKGLPEEDIKKLAEIADEKSYVAGSQIFSEGSDGDALYIVKSGTVRVIKRGQEEDEEISRMGPGQHFGEMAIIENDKRSATIDAQENTDLIRLKRDEFENLLSQDDALGYRVYRALARYLCMRLRQTTTDLSFIRGVAKKRGR